MEKMLMSGKFIYPRKSTEKGDGPVITNRCAIFFLKTKQSHLLSIQQEMSLWKN